MIILKIITIKKRNDKNNGKKYQKYTPKEEPIVEEVIEDDEISLLKDMLKEFEGTGSGAILDEALNITKEVDVEDLYEEIKNIETADTIIFDGIISQRLADIASLKNINKLVAFRSMNIVKKPSNIKIITMY